jgi:hypothetical protein
VSQSVSTSLLSTSISLLVVVFIFLVRQDVTEVRAESERHRRFIGEGDQHTSSGRVTISTGHTVDQHTSSGSITISTGYCRSTYNKYRVLMGHYFTYVRVDSMRLINKIDQNSCFNEGSNSHSF